MGRFKLGVLKISTFFFFWGGGGWRVNLVPPKKILSQIRVFYLRFG